MEDTPKYWYRLVDRLEGDETTSWTVVRLCKLIVIKETRKGVKLIGINHGRDNPRFVLRDAKKRWACPTIEEAVVSFVARKERQAGIYRARASHAEYARDAAVLGEYEIGPDWKEWGSLQ